MENALLMKDEVSRRERKNNKEISGRLGLFETLWRRNRKCKNKLKNRRTESRVYGKGWCWVGKVERSTK
jgi:hypothetical protein